jgi:hypothetical protein
MGEPQMHGHVCDGTQPNTEDIGAHPSEPPPNIVESIQKRSEQPSSQSERSFRESIKDWISIIQSVITVGAIALGGA